MIAPIIGCGRAVNKFPHAHFTTKIGIHSCLENLHWFTNFSMHSFFPRCYQVFYRTILFLEILISTLLSSTEKTRVLGFFSIVRIGTPPSPYPWRMCPPPTLCAK